MRYVLLDCQRIVRLAFQSMTRQPVQEPASNPLRPDFLKRQRALRDDRSIDRVLAHYLLERKLSDRLRRSSGEARHSVYTDVYKELFALLPDHPQRMIPQRAARVDSELCRITRRLPPESVFLEIGCGDAALAFGAAGRVRKAYGLDVTDSL